MVDFAENARSVSTPFVLFFSSSCRTGTPFLTEGAEARQDFLAFFRFFLESSHHYGIFPRLIALEIAARLFVIPISTFVCQDSRAKNISTPPCVVLKAKRGVR
jgi:hypothetical protein